MESLSTADIFQRIIHLEKELVELRQALLKLHGVELAKRQPGSLRGIWRGVWLEEEDFTEAKASLFPERDL
ncbi:MAG: hypothetical protein ACREQ3_09960 [Candidatus Binatia bacterium]